MDKDPTHDVEKPKEQAMPLFLEDAQSHEPVHSFHVKSANN